MARTPKRPRDPNQLAKSVVDLATMDEAELRALREKRATERSRVSIAGDRLVPRSSGRSANSQGRD